MFECVYTYLLVTIGIHRLIHHDAFQWVIFLQTVCGCQRGARILQVLPLAFQVGNPKISMVQTSHGEYIK